MVYMGAIKGGETLKVNFVNGKTAPSQIQLRIMGVAEATAVMEAAVPFWRKEDNLCGTGDSHRRTGASGTAGGSAD